MTEKVKDKNSWLGSVFVLTAGICWGFFDIITIYFLYDGASAHGAGKGGGYGLCGADGRYAAQYFYIKGRVYMDGDSRYCRNLCIHPVIKFERS